MSRVWIFLSLKGLLRVLLPVFLCASDPVLADGFPKLKLRQGDRLFSTTLSNGKRTHCLMRGPQIYAGSRLSGRRFLTAAAKAAPALKKLRLIKRQLLRGDRSSSRIERVTKKISAIKARIFIRNLACRNEAGRLFSPPVADTPAPLPFCNANMECEYGLGESPTGCPADCPLNVRTQHPYILWNGTDIETARTGLADNPWWSALIENISPYFHWKPGGGEGSAAVRIDYVARQGGYAARLSKNTLLQYGTFETHTDPVSSSQSYLLQFMHSSPASQPFRLTVVYYRNSTYISQKSFYLNSSQTWQSEEIRIDTIPAGTNRLIIAFAPGHGSPWQGTLLIDEVSLADASGRNYIHNGSFEEHNLTSEVSTALWDCYALEPFIYGFTLFHELIQTPGWISALNVSELLRILHAIPVNYSCAVDAHIRNKFFVEAMIYDHFNSVLTPAQKRDIRLEVSRMIPVIESGEINGGSTGFLSDHIIGTHRDGARRKLLAALLAFYGECEAELGCTEKLRFLHGFYTRHLHPYLEYMAAGGGHHYLFGYGAYSAFMHHHLWDKATFEPSFVPSWQEDKAMLSIYGLQKSPFELDSVYAEYPSFGDFFKTWGNLKNAEYASEFPAMLQYFSNPYLAQFLRQYFEPAAHRVYQLDWLAYPTIFYHTYAAQQAQPLEELPLARNFGNFSVMRSSWNLDDNLLLTFKSSRCQTDGHQHFDQNHYTLSYKSPLLVDSGEYDSWGSEHFHNYYSRTIAHNTLVVHDSSEGRPWLWMSNDGGQAYFDWAPSLEECRQQGLAGIEAFDTNRHYSYSRGDAARAYSSKVQGFKRHMLYIREAPYWELPVLVVRDEVSLEQRAAPLTGRILFHTINEPSVSASSILVPGDGDRLWIALRSPSLLSFTKIGGPGFEYWADGRNWPALENGRPMNPEKGNWRVEVAGSGSELVVNSVHFAAADQTSAPPAVIGADALVIANHDLLVFMSQDQQQFSFPPGTDYRRVYLIGHPLSSYRIEGTQNMLVTRDTSGPLHTNAQGIAFAGGE